MSMLESIAVTKDVQKFFTAKKNKEPKVFVIKDENRFRLDPDFVLGYAGHQPAWGYGPISFITYKRSYARPLSKQEMAEQFIRYYGYDKLTAMQVAMAAQQTSEEYWQTCARVCEGVSTVIKQRVRNSGQPWSDDEEQHHCQTMFKLMWTFKFLPPGRGMWMMGSEAVELKGAAGLNNCGFKSTESLHEDVAEPFCFVMDMSMLGVGMGFDLLGAGQVQVHEPTRHTWTFNIPDTREGWIECVRLIIKAFTEVGTLPKFNYDAIRKEGTPLKTFGGTASGPKPLIQLIDSLIKLFTSRVGHVLEGTDITDIMNMIGACVVAGNIRRSAEIALGSPDDASFIAAKDPSQIYEWQASQRNIANEIPAWTVLDKQIRKLRAQQAGIASVLDPSYVALQDKIDQKARRQKAILSKSALWLEYEDKINNHPLRTHRWASNNTVMCYRGMKYDALVEQTITNGEPGYAWPEIFRAFGRLADPANYRDREAKGFNPCVPAGTRILTREGYRPIDSLVGRKTVVWNGEAWATVEPKITGTNQPLVNVSLSDGTSLVCTDYHKWHLAPRRGADTVEVVRAVDLQPGDSLAKFDMPIVEGGVDWPSAYTHGVFCGDGQVNTGGTKSVLLYGVKKELLPFLLDTRPGGDDEYDRLYVGLSKDLPSKQTVPQDLSIQSRLDWFAGLLDTDGCVTRNPNSIGLQIVSIHKAFLQEVRLMLTTLGVQGKIGVEREEGERMLPDGKGGHAMYPCQASWRLVINASDTCRLVSAGLKTHRLDLPNLPPQRDARCFVTVKSVTKAGVADVVYCFEEPISHRGTFEGIVTGQCGEQTLFDRELCCLVETNPVAHETLEEFLETLKYAYRYAKAVTLIPTHNAKTNSVMVRNRRIGTSMAGVTEMYCKLGMQECIRWWDAGYAHIRRWDAIYSGWMDVKESIKVTSIKPGGSTPLLMGVEGGMKAPISPFYMRTIRIGHDSPLVDALIKAGYRIEKDRTTPRTVVAYFPSKAPDGVRSARQISLWEQAALFTALQEHWSDNMVSATLTFKPEEAKDIARVMEAYEGKWKCVSFLPLMDHGFIQAPYIPCTENEYLTAQSEIQPLVIEGNVHDTEEKFCSGGVCERPIEGSALA